MNERAMLKGYSKRAIVLLSVLLYSLPATSANSARVIDLESGEESLACYKNANLSGVAREIPKAELIDHCSRAPLNCKGHAESLFMSFAFAVPEQTEEALNLNLSDPSPCWVKRTSVKAVGLRVSTIKNKQETVQCDPHGGLGASACETE